MPMRRGFAKMIDGWPGGVFPWIALGILLVIAAVAPLLAIALIVLAIILLWPGPGGLTPIPVTVPERRGGSSTRSPRGPPSR